MFKAELAILIVSELSTKPYWMKQEVIASTHRAMKEEMREMRAAAIRNGYLIISEKITYKEV